jgi:enterochelin esterase-like enzyme/outer membrane protein assembly factor BamB
VNLFKNTAAGLAVGLLSWPAALAADWPQFGGPHHDGAVSEFRLPEDGLALEVVWRRALGPGYSGIAVAAGIGVTMYGDGTNDVLVAFDASSGKTRWTLALGAAYQGHDGSDDGPLSTPLIHGGRVFAVTPRGELVAATLDAGQPAWRVSLTEKFGAAVPEYGFTTSPVGAGDLVVVQVGGANGHGLCAFEAATGELRWKLGDEPAEYRSPVPLAIDGRTHLVAVSARTIRGVDPQDGGTLWEHSVAEDRYDSLSVIVPIGGGRFVVAGWEKVALFEIEPTDEGLVLAERWESTEIKQAYGGPVHRDGVLYGYSGSYLVAVDAATGKRLWKSRAPGKGAAIRVGDHLAIFAQGGKLHLAAASRDGFAPAVETGVLETAGLTGPAFADGVFFVRNLSEIAAVRVTGAPAARAGTAIAEPTASSRFGAFLRDLPVGAERVAAIDRLLDKEQRLPLHEDDGTVHFLFRGSAIDVGITGAVAPHGSAALARVPDTDLYYRSYRLDPAARYEYSFVVDFGEPQADPRNPLVAAGSEGKRSELRMPRWDSPAYAREPFSPPAGELATFEVDSAAMGEKRTVAVYLPAGHAAGERPLPLLVVPDVLGTQAGGHLPQIVDRLAAEGRPAPAVVFVPFGPGFAFWVEGYAARRDAMASFVVDEILPEVERRYRVGGERALRATAGFGWGAFPALYAAATRGDVFGHVASVSLLGNEPILEDLDRLLAARASAPRLLAWVGWGAYDQDPEFQEHTVLPAINRSLGELLGKHGHRVSTKEIPAGLGWGAFWVHVGPALDAFFAGAR